MKKDQRVRQSVCGVCEKSIKPGAGVVLAFGAGGRVHAKTCLKNAQNVTATGDRIAVEVRPRPAISTEKSY